MSLQVDIHHSFKPQKANGSCAICGQQRGHELHIRDAMAAAAAFNDMLEATYPELYLVPAPDGWEVWCDDDEGWVTWRGETIPTMAEIEEGWDGRDWRICLKGKAGAA